MLPAGTVFGLVGPGADAEQVKAFIDAVTGFLLPTKAASAAERPLEGVSARSARGSAVMRRTLADHAHRAGTLPSAPI